MRPAAQPSRRGTVFWATAVVGWAVMAWGVAGIVRQHVDTRPADLARFVVGGILVHDLVAVPLALGAALVVARVTARRWRPWVLATLVIVACLALFAYPLVRNYGNIPGNPTALPHDYAANLTIVSVAVAAISAVVATVRARRGRPADHDRPG